MRQSTIWATAVAIIMFSSAMTSAEADSNKAPRASVVAIMNDAGQALLWDGEKGEYVVVRQGDRFHEFRVTSIEPDQVVLTRRGTRDHFILPRTSDTSELASKGKGKGGHASPGTSPGMSPGAPDARRPGARDPSEDLLDPYPRPRVEEPSAAGIGDLSMLDPYGTTAPVRTVIAPRKKPPAPLDPYASGASSPTSSPTSSSSSTSAPLDPYATTSSSSSSTSASDVGAPLDPYGAATPSTPSSTPAKKGKVRKERHRISRREFDAAVADFHELSKTVQFSIVEAGVRIDGIGKGSLFHRWGFRSGDVIVNVDGTPIRGVDDAAAVYAKLMDTRRFKVEVKRGVDTVQMNFRFKK